MTLEMVQTQVASEREKNAATLNPPLSTMQHVGI